VVGLLNETDLTLPDKYTKKRDKKEQEKFAQVLQASIRAAKSIKKHIKSKLKELPEDARDIVSAEIVRLLKEGINFSDNEEEKEEVKEEQSHEDECNNTITIEDDSPPLSIVPKQKPASIGKRSTRSSERVEVITPRGLKPSSAKKSETESPRGL